jgi:hypothetical protein
MQLDCPMMTVDDPESSQRTRKFRAPREHGGLLAVPPLACAADLLALNRARRQTYETMIGDMTVYELGQYARNELLQVALHHTGAYRHVVPMRQEKPIIMSGHQPDLFHPGVWVKNFALDRVARETNAIAIQLLVDNDVIGSAEIQIPVQSPRAHDDADTDQRSEIGARLVSIPMDDPRTPVPHEERSIANPAFFDLSGSRLESAIRPIVPDPVVRDLWPRAVAARKRQSAETGRANLGETLAEARHQLEHSWGLDTLEAPLSRVCQGDAFRRFAAHLLAGLQSFRTIYNRALMEYRKTNRLRSNSHPAPTLVQVGEFYEAPFWIWTAEDPTRRPLFVARRNQTLVLRNGPNGQPWSIACEADDISISLASHLAALETDHGVKLRPRALITTLFARLFLCDLFLHGIGGGKYDQVTDQIAVEFLGCQPPAYLVLSATLYLPCARVPVERDDIRQVDGLLRELVFHPDRYAEQVRPEAAARFAKLVADKRSWLAEKPTFGSARGWHRRLEDTNEKLRSFLTESRSELLSERKRLIQRRLSDKVLSSREYSFCLFPANTLRSELLRQVQSEK